MAKTMAEVLAEHTAWATTNPDGVWLVTCVDCRSTLGTYDAIVPKEIDRSGGSYDYMDAALAAHQAAALSAAGYGLVADAKREALESAADDLDLPGSSASGYYASEQDGGYREAERHVEAWLTTRAAEMRQG